MSDVIRQLHDELDSELDRLPSSADPEGDDEPELEAYATRLHSLHEAVAAQDRRSDRWAR
jgi:hypothetical protein